MISNKRSIIYNMARGLFIFIAIISFIAHAGAATPRGVATAGRTGNATAANQTVNPASSYTYNYMYPYLNNQMRTTLHPTDATSQSTSPINTVVRTEQLSAPRQVVPRRTTQTATTTNTTSNTSTAARAATNVAMGANTARRVVPRRTVVTTNNAPMAARATTSRSETSIYKATDTNTNKVVSSSRCLADYTACMNDYCERTDTAYNRCYCSAKLAQIDAQYQPEIEALIKQIVELQYNASSWDASEMNEYWMSVVGKYTGNNSWTTIDDALNIDWSTTENRVRGQNAFVTGHEYCIQHIQGCFYMANNLRDAYRSTISRDCASYEAGLEKLKTAAESVIGAYQE